MSWDELDLYDRVRTSLAQAGLVNEVYVSSGSLLGIVRDGGKIVQDDDFDSAYVIDSSDSREISSGLVDVATHLNSKGFDAHVSVPMKTHLHVHDAEDYGIRMDVFVNYLEDGMVRVPAGIATSRTEFRWDGTKCYLHGGVEICMPNHVQEYLAFYYGPDWMIPKTGKAWRWGKEERRSWGSMCLIDERA